MTEVLLTGLKIGESARWHDGRLWLSNWGARQILAVDLDRHAEVMAMVPTTMPFSIDWLPDGRLLVAAGPGARRFAGRPRRPARAGREPQRDRRGRPREHLRQRRYRLPSRRGRGS